METILGIVVMVILVVVVYNKIVSIWGKYYYMDEFGKFTNVYHIRLKKKAMGLFANSATSKDIMSYCLYIEQDRVAFRFWDYEKYEQKNTDEDPCYWDMKCLGESSGERMECELIMQGYDSYLDIVEEEDVTKFINLLKNNKRVEIIITSGVHVYKFFLKRGNFKKLYEKLYK